MKVRYIDDLDDWDDWYEGQMMEKMRKANDPKHLNDGMSFREEMSKSGYGKREILKRETE